MCPTIILIRLMNLYISREIKYSKDIILNVMQLKQKYEHDLDVVLSIQDCEFFTSVKHESQC